MSIYARTADSNIQAVTRLTGKDYAQVSQSSSIQAKLLDQLRDGLDRCTKEARDA